LERGLGLARNIGLLGLLAATFVLAAGATATPAPTLFRVTVVGTAHQDWTYTAPPVKTGDCSRTEKSEGIRNATFRTTRPIVAGLSGGRVLTVDLRGIAGTVTLAGANTTEDACAGGTGTAKIADCVQSRRSFAGARVRLASPQRGIVAMGLIRNAALAMSACPTEPADVRRRPLGPAPGALRLPQAALTEQRISSMTLSGSRTQRKTYASPEAGRLVERVQWRVTFTRVGR
jgi:hypothetical protein